MGCYKLPMGSGLIQNPPTFKTSTLDSFDRKTGQSATEPLLIASGSASAGGCVPTLGLVLVFDAMYTFLVGGFSNPSEKYARQNGFIFPNFRGENKQCHLKPPPRFGLPPLVSAPQDAGDNRDKLEGWEVGIVV